VLNRNIHVLCHQFFFFIFFSSFSLFFSLKIEIGLWVQKLVSLRGYRVTSRRGLQKFCHSLKKFATTSSLNHSLKNFATPANLCHSLEILP
jgi:hypothetical protein